MIGKYTNWVVLSNHYLCSPAFGEDSHFDKYFPTGLKPPTTYSLWEKKPFLEDFFGERDYNYTVGGGNSSMFFSVHPYLGFHDPI